jgi:hypothetical protein
MRSWRLVATRADQAAGLDRAPATALTELSDEKAALDAQVATLRQMESHHRSQMRHHLTEQLSMLDTTLPEARAVFPG